MRRLSFPSFEDEYDPQKMRALVNEIERRFENRPYEPAVVRFIEAATASVLGTDEWLIVRYTDTGACAIALPPVEVFKGRVLTIRDDDENASINNITAVDDVFGTVLTIATDGESVDLASDGVSWFVKGRS